MASNLTVNWTMWICHSAMVEFGDGSRLEAVVSRLEAIAIRKKRKRKKCLI